VVDVIPAPRLTQSLDHGIEALRLLSLVQLLEKAVSVEYSRVLGLRGRRRLYSCIRALKSVARGEEVQAKARLVYEAGSWEIDVGRRELRAGGALVPLGGRAFEIVETLVRAAGQLVTKDDLMAQVWPGAIVEDNTLQVHISAIRKALGTDRGMLKTVSGRGYRLMGSWRIRKESASVEVDLPAQQRAAHPFLTNIPVAASALIGRETSVQYLCDLLSAYRMVTLTGPGGIGKTVLAAEAGRRLFPAIESDVLFVELASLSDPELVPSAVASVLALELGGGEISPESVARAVANKKLLIVLDNSEHVIETAARMAEALLHLCPRTTVLATSREVLRVEGEQVYRVPPLEVPPKDGSEANAVLEHSAVQLFVARTRSLRSDFRPEDEDLPAMAAICRRLDGIPLAIEFAAARAAALGFREVATRLDDRFRLLTVGRRTALPRHQTLRATLDWSYELLPEQEQCLLRRLAVIPAGFTLEAATAVMAETGQDASMVVTNVLNLVAKSLVAPDGSVPTGRWRLLESIRAYALEKLVETNEVDAASRCHAEYLCEFIASAAPGSRSDSTLSSLTLCSREIDNVRAALDWAFSTGGDNKIGVALTAAYVPVWLHFSWHAECRDRIEHALEAFEANPNRAAPLRMQLCGGLGLALFQTMGAVDRIAVTLTEALRLAEELNDIDAQLRTLWELWLLHHDTGNCRAALATTNRFAEVARRAGDPAVALVADRLAGYSLQFGGDLAAAQRCIDRVLELYRAPMDRRHRFWFLHDQLVAAHDLHARSLWLRGFVDQATDHAHACLEEAKVSDNSLSICEAIRLAVAPIAIATGDLAGAERAIVTLIDHAKRYHNLNYWNITGSCLRGELLIRQGAFAKGVDLLDDALGRCERTGWAVCYPGFKGVLAEGLAGLGRIEEALAAVEQAVTAANLGGERWYLAELFRIKAACLLEQASGKRSEATAEACFTRALDIARRQGALFWELRAATHLARLRVKQDHAADARQVLAPVYARFREGFETADLRSARQALSTLPATS
jgi:predicted ATPase/DNA-binding winged helix-turn-helix (wHTH) protein